MSLILFHYYIMKSCQSRISSSITFDVSLDNQVFFKYALFYNVQNFYKLLNPFKKDSYQLSSKIKGEKFPNFLLECLENAYYHSSDEEKLFCYTLLMNHIIEKNISFYIEAFTPPKKSKEYVEKMIDSYMFHKNEGISLSKINLANYFFDSFSLSEADYHLLEKPIKKVFGFFCTKNYYKECYNSGRIYFDYLSTSKTGIKRIFYWGYDLLFNHRKGKPKAKHFLYHKKIDTSLLNLNHSTFELNDTQVTYSIDEMVQYIVKEVRRGCDILNTYFNNNQNLKPFETYFHMKIQKS